MKRIRIIFPAICLLLGLPFVACDDMMPKVEQVGVESVALSDELVDGLTIGKGTTVNIANKVILTPENATDRAQTFYSSNVDVATVNGLGDLTAHAEGTSEISIYVGGKSVEFTLTVFIIPAEDITIAIPSLTLNIGEEYAYDLSTQLAITPWDANDGVTYTSSEPTIVSVTEKGILEGLAEGQSVITVASQANPEVKATITVTSQLFRGDYSRKGWVMSAASQNPLFTNTTDMTVNNLTTALDGDLSTAFALVKPGKSVSGVSCPADSAVWFIVDMKQEREINYFRLRNRDTMLGLMWQRFDEISGSHDGENFTTIATYVTGTGVYGETANIAFRTCTYRYVKFYGKDPICYTSNVSGESGRGSLQIIELYLGLTR
ncbi:MAG: Ig-like domain-containing protein [Dysgonamonadaceae bacterium]|jgi:hypothetical protein|nr:Ig-like domain-containing protein [Dysgonamonadaceae bacterium]